MSNRSGERATAALRAADAGADKVLEAERVGAFSFSNYRRFFIGQSLSNIGTWFQMVAQALLVLKITGRASSLGEVFAVQSFPMLVIGPFVGPFIDRANLRKVLVVVSIWAGAEAFALAWLVESHRVTVLWILGLSFLLGFGQMFTQPSMQAFLPELVSRDAMASAVSLNSVQQSIGRLAGPAAAGLLYAWRGAAACYFINGISYAVVLVSLCLLRRKRLFPRVSAQRSPRQFIEAMSFVWHSNLHRGQLLANLAIGCLAFNFPIYYSSFTQLVLHSGSASFGIAESINASFAVACGLFMSRKLRNPTRRSYILGCLALGSSLALTSLAPNIVIFYLDMAYFGVALVIYTAINQTVLQLNTPRERMGSVMTLSAYGNQGMTPIGSLITGWLIGLATARAALGLGAATALGAAVVLSIARARHRNDSPAIAADPATVSS